MKRILFLLTLACVTQVGAEFVPSEQFYESLTLVENALQEYTNSGPSKNDYTNLINYLSSFRSWYQALKPAPQELYNSLSPAAQTFIEQVKQAAKPFVRAASGVAGRSRLSEEGVQFYQETLEILKSPRFMEFITGSPEVTFMIPEQTRGIKTFAAKKSESTSYSITPMASRNRVTSGTLYGRQDQPPFIEIPREPAKLL